jgi:hypothetical protein
LEAFVWKSDIHRHSSFVDLLPSWLPSSTAQMKLRVRHSPNNQAPHSLKEQRYVLSKEQIAHLLPALERSHFTEAADVEDGIAAEDWGIQYTPIGQPADPVVSQIVHHIAANNEYIRTHSPPAHRSSAAFPLSKWIHPPPLQQDLVSSLNTTGTRTGGFTYDGCLHSL